MTLNETKKDLNPEIKKVLKKKSKLKVLTNENDYLVKNLKKAGWYSIDLKIFFQIINPQKFFSRANNDFSNDQTK